MSRFSIEETPTDVLMKLASRHKELRKKSGYTQQELASRSGVSLGSIKRFEQSGLISLESLLQLAAILNRLDDFDMLFQPKEDLSRLERLFTNP
jgi:transcriptional regulator with XRE-family HTH domain